MIFPAKVLLFGEYSILNGSNALAIPFNTYGGRVKLKAKTAKEIDSSSKFIEYLNWILDSKFSDLNINSAKIREDIALKAWFSSSIPLGSGLGSSGSIVASCAHRYSNLETITSLEQRMSIFAKLEGFFHGNSSGIDPLVSYQQNAIQIINNKIKASSKFKRIDFQLIPSDNEVKTSDLIAIYKVKLRSDEFKNQILNEYIPLVNRVVSSFFNPSYKLHSDLFQLTEMQLKLFPEMLGKKGRDLAVEGLLSKKYAIKLCGSGGGYLLKFPL